MTAAHVFAALDDEALIDRLQRAAFGYIEAYTDPVTGLVADTSRPGSPASIAVVGFALAAYPVAVERGWISRRAAARRVLTTLTFFRDSAQGEEDDATGYKGFYYHFLDMKTGRRVWRCELSMIDSGLLFAGMLAAQAYFDGDTDTEAAIRALADGLYRRVDWIWARNGFETLAQGWKPDYGFLRCDWEGYDEATVLYLLALGSPSHPLATNCFSGWTMTYQWENLLGYDVLYCGPLFTHLFSHAFVDFRGLRDAFMREKGSDYFENTCRTIALHREYAVRNPLDFEGYDRDFWGITAGDGPDRAPIREAGRERRFLGYMSRGAPYGPDDGTISPWAMLATLPFAREAALSGTRALLCDHPWTCRRGRFVSGYNPTLRPHGGRGWLSDGWYGLDQGLLVLLIENARSGLIWRLMRGCDVLVQGLRRAGFEGGWLSP